MCPLGVFVFLFDEKVWKGDLPKSHVHNIERL